MPTMERIPISEWEQQASYSFHTHTHTHANATHPTNTALAIITKNDDNDNIAPTVSECRSDITNYPTTAPQPTADDKQQRPNDTTSSSADACPVAVANTSRSTNTNRSDDYDEEEESDEEIGAMIYASSKTARDRRAAAEAASAVTSDQSPSSYEPRSEVRKRKREISSDISSNEMESAPKKKRVTKKSFERRIEALRAYKEEHGHVNVKGSEDKSLYEFCINMRYTRKHPEKYNRLIDDDSIASLDALGFDWSLDSRIKSFEQRIADLKAYKEKNGHINVKKSDDKSLNKFCSNIRHARKHPKKSTVALTDDRIASLDALGFDWSVSERKTKKTFEQRIADLQAYKEKHGHVNVKGSEDKSLYQFCINMRYTRNNPEKSNMAVTDDRIASLDALGFEWSMNRTNSDTKSFEQRTAELRKYKEKHGHINVKQSEDKSLYKFCYNVRYARINPEKSNVTLTMDRIASLDALVFDWSVTERGAKKSFKQRMDELRAYKEKHGHIKVKRSEDKSLYQFCADMRQARNNPEKSTTLINEERIASLDALGFEWNMNIDRKSFQQRMDDLRAYKEEHGHVNVKGSDDKSLYGFCSNMRQARKHPEKSGMLIIDDRITSLDALGFDWTVKSFEQRIADLKAYKESNIGSEEMESAPKKKRIFKSFEQRIVDLKAYKEEHGHVNVIGSEDKSLNQFCWSMRQARVNPERSSKLNEERIACLDALGFDWRAAAKAASAVNSNQSSSSYEPRSIIRKREISSDISSKEMESAPNKKKRMTKSFEQGIEDPRAYKEKNGHIKVKKSEDKCLSEFCRNMRRARNNPEKSTVVLTDDRITSLDALGFDWSMNSTNIKSFEQRIEDLRAYKEKNRHVNVKKSEDKSLYGFCNHMRHARNNPEKSKALINDDRISSLDALGFDWAVKEQGAKKLFDQRVDDLRVYKEEHGHVNVKHREDKSLYDFCGHIRRARNNPDAGRRKLTAEDIASLDALGFNWSIKEQHAKKSFAQRQLRSMGV